MPSPKRMRDFYVGVRGVARPIHIQAMDHNEARTLAFAEAKAQGYLCKEDTFRENIEWVKVDPRQSVQRSKIAP